MCVDRSLVQPRVVRNEAETLVEAAVEQGQGGTTLLHDEASRRADALYPLGAAG